VGQLRPFWNRIPRWQLGWFLGNLVYSVLAILGWRSEILNLLVMFPSVVVIGPLYSMSNLMMLGEVSNFHLFLHNIVLAWLHLLFSHFAWCLLCAVLVAWKKEVMGMIIAVLLMLILSLVFYLWVLSHFTISAW